MTAHLAPYYKLRRTSGMQWSGGKCPVCQGTHCLSLRIKNGRIELHCNRRPSCDQATLMETVASRFPRCITQRQPKRQPDIRANVEAIVLDGSLSPSAMRLRLLMLTTGLSARAAAKKLGYPRSTYYAAVSDLGDG